DEAQRRLDPERAEVLDVGHVMRLERRFIEQEFDAEHLAFRRHPLAVLAVKASLFEQMDGPAQQLAILTRSVGHWRHERHAEHLVRYLAAERLEQRHFLRR